MNEDCPHCVFEITEANCRGCFEGSHYKPKQITNADRIRSMTDEELAEAFAMQCAGRVCKGIPFDGKNECVNCWLDWLKQEAKE